MPKILQPTLIQKTDTVSVTVTPTPITKVGDTSTAGTTTYTSKTVVDGTGWDLSAISEGDVLKTTSGYKAIVRAVDDGNDTLTVDGWMTPTGLGPDPRVIAQKPADGVAVTIHRISQAKLITITAALANTQVIYVGLDETARITDYPLAAGASVVLADDGYLDITRIYVRSASGTQSAEWIVDAAVTGNVAVSIVLSGPFSFLFQTFPDGDTTPDVSSGSGWRTANTNLTTLTNFDNPSANGQFIWISATDALKTTIANNANIKLQGALDFGPMAVNDTLLLGYNGSLWEEYSRSLNS